MLNRSMTTKATNKATASASSPTVLGDPHPLVEALVMPYTRVTMPSVDVRAPGMS